MLVSFIAGDARNEFVGSVKGCAARNTAPASVTHARTSLPDSSCQSGTGANFSISQDSGYICFSHLLFRNKSREHWRARSTCLPDIGYGKLKSLPWVRNM